MKPKGLAETTIVMCLMNLAGFVFIDPAQGELTTQYLFIGVIVAATFLVLWFYWVGKNWARILVLLGAAMSILNLLFLPAFGTYAAVVVIAEGVFGLFMLWWLNTRVVKSFFNGTGENSV